jgi:peptidoglycan/LPS O-acetylase OafA/YrhL
MMVLVSHFSNSTGLLGNLLGGGAGKLGVLLFFILSGFLMGWLYREQPLTREAVTDFARRRFARIAPLFVFTVVLTYVLHWTAWRQFAVVSMSTRHFLETLLLWEGRGIFWTIPVEVQFYFVFPLIWWISAKAPRLWMPLTIIAGIALLLATKARFPVLLDYGAAFMVGILLSSLKGKPRTLTANLIFLTSLAGLVLLYPGLWRMLGIKPPDAFHSPLHMLVFGGLVWSAIRSPIGTAIFGNALARFIGNISFSLYLLHYMVYRVLAVTPLASNRLLFLLSFVISAIGVAALSYRFIEVPSRRWLARPKTAPASPSVGSVAPSVAESA